MLPLTREQLREIDRRATDDYHIPGIVLMENAARNAADCAMSMLSSPDRSSVLVLCGPGNNGGDGLAIARHLHNRGVRIQIALATEPAKYRGDALINWNIVQAMRLPVANADPSFIRSTRWALIIDAIFGTGVTQPPRDPFPALAQAVNASELPVLAVDVPSGLDCDTGLAPGVCIAATRTITFVAPKTGFANPAAARYLGEVVVGDIGCPVELIDAVR